MDMQLARQSVADAGRMLLGEGLVSRTWGNISCRINADSYAITPSGLGYEHMRPEDVAIFHMGDGTYDGARKPSSEKGVHTAAYRQFADAAFIIHTHQTYATALGLAGFDAHALSSLECGALGGVALAPYGLPGTKHLTRNVAKALSTGAHTVLMAHHGVLIVGQTPEQAFERAKLLEAFCMRACKGQPSTETVPDKERTALAQILLLCAQNENGCAALTTASAVIEASCHAHTICAQLDDMAQMIGPWLVAVPAEEGALLAALRKHNAVLIPGVGAICRAGTEGDVTALCQLTEKACICHLHTAAYGKSEKLSLPDALLMRRIYVQKYEKKIGG